MPPPIRKIGCIHFDNAGVANPLATIRAAFANCAKDLADALIVLPEALNLGDGYYSAHTDPRFTISELRTISRELSVAFVAGLKEDRLFRKPFNSAFLIDPECTRRLSRKMHGDHKFARWYAPKHHGEARCINYRGLTVASLICQDATEFRPAPNNEPLHASVSKCLNSGQSPILCVPARMTTYTPALVANAWPPTITVVVANVTGCSGFRLANAEWKQCQEGLCLEPLLSPHRAGIRHD